MTYTQIEQFEALKKVKNTSYEFWGNEKPKCPHCGVDCDIDKNDWYDIYNEGDHDKDCPYCDGKFHISTRVTFKFDTDEQEF